MAVDTTWAPNRPHMCRVDDLLGEPMAIYRSYHDFRSCVHAYYNMRRGAVAGLRRERAGGSCVQGAYHLRRLRTMGFCRCDGDIRPPVREPYPLLVHAVGDTSCKLASESQV